MFAEEVGGGGSFLPREMLCEEKGRWSKTRALTVVGMNDEALTVMGKETSVMRQTMSDDLALV